MRIKKLRSKSFANWTGTFVSLSCMACPAVFSQWSLAFFFFCLGGLFVRVGAWWQTLLVLDAFNLKRRFVLWLPCVASRAWDEVLPFWNAVLLISWWLCFHPCAHPTCTYKHSFGFHKERCTCLIPCSLPCASEAPSPRFMSYFSPGSCTGSRPKLCFNAMDCPSKGVTVLHCCSPSLPEGWARVDKGSPSQAGIAWTQTSAYEWGCTSAFAPAVIPLSPIPVMKSPWAFINVRGFINISAAEFSAEAIPVVLTRIIFKKLFNISYC